jgi:hypothetical protein
MKWTRSILTTVTTRQLFLLDGLGAAVTAVMLGVVLPAFEPAFAMPKRSLLALALVAASFAAYSLTCHARAADARFLLGIAVANAAYCVCTLGLLVSLRGSLTWLDMAYFLGEIFVIATLVIVEVVVALRART